MQLRKYFQRKIMSGYEERDDIKTSPDTYLEKEEIFWYIFFAKN